MELVKGVPITRYCDEHQLTPRQRLELFVPVCQAVQHAHQKGVIHRDLKPSNVLVAPYDGRPVPKVIDFGVAKAAGQPLTDKTLVTGLGAVVGTPEYMSPEQAELNNLDVDTRSDIYSPGRAAVRAADRARRPLQKKRVRAAALLEVLRLVREEEPPRPSTRLSTTDELPSIAANRGLEPRKLSGLVRGELDWIVMKALEKDRSRRYETANGVRGRRRSATWPTSRCRRARRRRATGCGSSCGAWPRFFPCCRALVRRPLAVGRSASPSSRKCAMRTRRDRKLSEGTYTPTEGNDEGLQRVASTTPTFREHEVRGCLWTVPTGE